MSRSDINTDVERRRSEDSCVSSACHEGIACKLVEYALWFSVVPSVPELCRGDPVSFH